MKLLLALFFLAALVLVTVRLLRKPTLPFLTVEVAGGADLVEGILWLLWVEKNWSCHIQEVAICLQGVGEAQEIARLFAREQNWPLVETAQGAKICLTDGQTWRQVCAQLEKQKEAF